MENRTTKTLEHFVASTTGPMTVVAPYITRPAMKKMLALLEDRPVRVYTDWSKQAVRSGSTDPEIFGDVIKRKNGSEVWLHKQLHAKLYYTSQGCLVGSANLTGRGIGWHVTPNLELLVPVPAGDGDVKALLADLKKQTREATWDDVDHALLAAKVHDAAPTDEDAPVRHLRIPVGQTLIALDRGEAPPEVIRDLYSLGLPASLEPEDTVILARRTARATSHYALADTLRRLGGTREDQVTYILNSSHYFGLEAPSDREDAGHILDVLCGWMALIFPRTFEGRTEGNRMATAPLTMGRF